MQLAVGDADGLADAPCEACEAVDEGLGLGHVGLQEEVLLRDAVHLGLLQVLLLLPLVAVALVLRQRLLRLGVQAPNLLLHLVDVQVQAVHVLEPVEVELLDLDEMRDEVLDLGEARRDLPPHAAPWPSTEHDGSREARCDARHQQGGQVRSDSHSPRKTDQQHAVHCPKVNIKGVEGNLQLLERLLK